MRDLAGWLAGSAHFGRPEDGAERITLPECDIERNQLILWPCNLVQCLRGLSSMSLATESRIGPGYGGSREMTEWKGGDRKSVV